MSAVTDEEVFDRAFSVVHFFVLTLIGQRHSAPWAILLAAVSVATAAKRWETVSVAAAAKRWETLTFPSTVWRRWLLNLSTVWRRWLLNLPSGAVQLSLALLLSVTSSSRARAHEGHQPLPTKGVAVDTKRGQLVLSDQARTAIGLETEEVRVGQVSSTLTTYAETVAPWQAKAYGSAQISGRITKLHARPGDVVSQGQVIAELSSRELETLRLSYLQAQNEVALNRKLLEASAPAARQGAVPRQRIDEIENALAQSQNDLEIASIRASTLGLDAKEFSNDGQEIHHFVRSPIAGRIIHSDLTEGKFVEAFEHLFDIVNLDNVWVKIQVLEKDIQHLALGQKVELTLLDQAKPIETKIDWIDVALDPQGQVCWAWATIASDSASGAAVMPGLVGSARIQTSVETKRLSVPVRSVYSDGLQSYVFVEESSTKASAEYRKRNIKLGQRLASPAPGDLGNVEVIQGAVFPGDRVVIKGGHELSSLFFLDVLKLTSEDRTRLGIRTAEAEVRPISHALNLAAMATLPPDARWTASSQLAGTIHSHTLSPGKKIVAGELLIEIASPDFHAAQLDLLRTSLDASLIRERANRLQQSGRDVLSQRALLEMLNRADQLELKVESLKRQLVTIGLSSSEVANIVAQRQIIRYLPVRAPMDGVLVRYNGTLGETVVANQPLADIQKLQNAWIEVQVPSQDTSSLSLKDVGIVSVLSNPAIRFPASVSRVGPIISPTTRTQRIWLVPDSMPDNLVLRDGMQLSVAMNVNQRVTSLAVPSEAILRDGLHAFVFVQKNDGYLERRRVTTGRNDGQWTEVREGISAGDQLL